jgi:uncharacterized membrane protein YfcA
VDTALTITLILLSFSFELVDSTFGMGYGTLMTPILLALGFKPLEIVPVVLFSESMTGVLAGFSHYKVGNVNYSLGSRDLKVAAILMAFSFAGVLTAVLIAINLPPRVVELYIGVLVLAFGLLILKKRNREFPFSWKRIIGLGFLAAFNKGISGGGYGQIVTGGQVYSGMRGQNAVGITCLVEGLISIAGLAVYMLSGTPILWHIVIPITIGAAFSVPIASYMVRGLTTNWMTSTIGFAAIALGSFTLLSLML